MTKKVWILLWVSTWCIEVFSKGRSKRVIYGEPLNDRSTAAYSAMKYFVWIGFGRAVTAFDAILPPRYWDTQRQICGGALLTAKVIQTACHCFCGFMLPPTEKELFSRAVRNEHNFDTVAGWNYVNDAPQPIGIVKYYIHPLCGDKYWVYQPERNFTVGFVVHDYALATLETEVQLLTTVQPAPVYPLSEMAEMWTGIMSKGAVCLLIGFGRYLSRDSNVKSPVLRHGWEALTSYKQCFDAIAAGHDVNMTEYQELATWSCMLPFGPNEVHDAKGDSGSPVTCDNRYFSIVSGYTKGADLYQDLVYYAFANSIEYRAEMISLMDSSDSEAQNVTARGGGRFTPGTAPPNFYVATSSASFNGLGVLLHSLAIVSATHPI